MVLCYDAVACELCLSENSVWKVVLTMFDIP